MNVIDRITYKVGDNVRTDQTSIPSLTISQIYTKKKFDHLFLELDINDFEFMNSYKGDKTCVCEWDRANSDKEAKFVLLLQDVFKEDFTPYPFTKSITKS